MTTIEEVRTAGREGEQRAIDTMVLAFASDPWVRWLFPETGAYLTYFPRLVRALGGRAFEGGTAFSAGSCATALWLSPGVEPSGQEVIAIVEEAVSPGRREPLMSALAQLDEHHPPQPRWYLPFIGVDPAAQGRGYGSALLAHALERCDAEHAPAFLETGNERNVPLYERHGFRVAGVIGVTSTVKLWPMVRNAR